MPKVIVALDVPSRDRAMETVRQLGQEATFYKVGLELFTAAGPAIVGELRAQGKRVFLDLKLHDIPTTVAGAVRSAAGLGVELLTVHVSGGDAMLRAAADAAGGRVQLLGVTLLTSLPATEVERCWGRRGLDMVEEVVRLALMAREAGLHGVVTSPLEVAEVRARTGPGFLLVTPGIRPAGTTPQDQKRVATPADAVRSGADHLVVGRAVTRADDPPAALRAIRREAEGARGTGAAGGAGGGGP